MTQIPHDRTILVTGAGGRLGRLLRRAALRDGAGDCRFLFQSRAPGADVTWAPGDEISALPPSGMVVALWGCTSGTAEELTANARLVATSHAVARSCGARRLLHLSSAAVYGPGHSMNEADPPHPAGEYGRAKLAMERAVARLRRGDGIEHCCLRLANVVGADSLAAGLRSGGPVSMDRFPGGAGPLRSYIGAGDLVRVILGLATLPPGTLPDLLNVAVPEPVPMDALVQAAGLGLAWRPAPESAVPEVTLDAGRLTRLLPSIAYRATAADMIADWKDLEETA